jgi:hypothetical protein
VKGEMLMQVYWGKSDAEIIPAVVKRQGRKYTWIAVLNQEKGRVPVFLQISV